MCSNRVIAGNDPQLVARVTNRWPLSYSSIDESVTDHPAHARAGSGLCWYGSRLAVVQDDANFIALVDPPRGTVDAVVLPEGRNRSRLFDDSRGNKEYKHDLEACVSLETGGDELLVSFGSGSTPQRETIVVMRCMPVAARPEVRLFPAPDLYAALRECRPFSGSELNIEGAVMLKTGRLMLFQRGNGARRGDLTPVNATCELEWEALWSHLADGAANPVPPLHQVIQYDLGSVDDVPLTFTDATSAPAGSVLYVACAEDSPDAVQDGVVTGTAIGIVSPGAARWTRLLDEQGDILREKAEGIVMQPENPRHGFLCLDVDNPDKPSELCEIELLGEWF